MSRIPIPNNNNNNTTGGHHRPFSPSPTPSTPPPPYSSSNMSYQSSPVNNADTRRRQNRRDEVSFSVLFRGRQPESQSVREPSERTKETSSQLPHSELALCFFFYSFFKERKGSHQQEKRTGVRELALGIGSGRGARGIRRARVITIREWINKQQPPSLPFDYPIQPSVLTITSSVLAPSPSPCIIIAPG